MLSITNKNKVFFEMAGKEFTEIEVYDFLNSRKLLIYSFWGNNANTECNYSDKSIVYNNIKSLDSDGDPELYGNYYEHYEIGDVYTDEVEKKMGGRTLKYVAFIFKNHKFYFILNRKTNLYKFKRTKEEK